MIPTADPDCEIEAQSPGVVRYVQRDGRRWEVHGICDRRGDCLIGAYIEGFGVIATHADIPRACAQLGLDRPDSLLDVPVTPEFSGCCPFMFVIL